MRTFIYFNVEMYNMKKEVNIKPVQLYKFNELLFVIGSIIFNLTVRGAYISSILVGYLIYNLS